jgi:hypothetical protein
MIAKRLGGGNKIAAIFPDGNIPPPLGIFKG